MARSSQITPTSEAIGDLPSVPMWVRSLDGQLIETGANIWRMRTCSDGGDVLTINWERLRAMRRGFALATRAEHLARLYLADRLCRRKSSTIHNDFSTFLYFEDWLWNKAGVRRFDWSDLTEALARSSLHTASNTAPKRGIVFHVCARSMNGVLPGSIRISTGNCFESSKRSQRSGMRRDITFGSATRLGDRFPLTNSY